jgi:hypothetical protein
MQYDSVTVVAVDGDIDESVVVEVSKRGPASGHRYSHCRPALARDIAEQLPAYTSSEKALTEDRAELAAGRSWCSGHLSENQLATHL